MYFNFAKRQVVSAKVHINAPTSWFVENVPRLLKDKPASEEIDEAIEICELINYTIRLIFVFDDNVCLFAAGLRNNRNDVAQLLIKATQSKIKASRFKSTGKNNLNAFFLKNY